MTTNMIALIGETGNSKTTTAASMMMNPLRQHAMQGVVGHASYPGWVADTSGFLIQQVSPPMKAAMDRLGENLFPKNVVEFHSIPIIKADINVRRMQFYLLTGK